MTRPAVGHHVTDVTPECCNEPMVHNTATGAYECADAYFALVDEQPGLADVMLELVEDGEVPAGLVETLRHWRASIRRCVTCWPEQPAEKPQEVAP
jgi:hypothetical protein